MVDTVKIPSYSLTINKGVLMRILVNETRRITEDNFTLRTIYEGKIEEVDNLAARHAISKGWAIRIYGGEDWASFWTRMGVPFVKFEGEAV